MDDHRLSIRESTAAQREHDQTHPAAYYSLRRPTLIERLFPRQVALFPARWDGVTDRFTDKPETHESGYLMRHDVFIRLDWRDRLRLLLSGNLLVDVRVRTSAPSTRAEALSTVSVLKPTAHRDESYYPPLPKVPE